MSRFAVGSVEELTEVLRTNAASTPRRRVRLVGRGTRQRLCAPPPPETLELSLQRLAQIERLEPDDLTCSLQPGVPCAELAAALAERQLELGGLRADDPGTIGGLYAADPLGPPSPGGACPRSTLLGVEAALGDGSSFRSGARVVKSVAGFDVHKLLVGSQGRLFAATLLHLKLRPAPRARAAFATAPLTLAEALRVFLALRQLPTPPQRLLLRGIGGTATLHGAFAGRPNQVRTLLRTDPALREHDTAFADQLPPPAADRELLVGRTRAIRLADVLAGLPADAAFLAHGGGHFECELAPAAADALLARLPQLDASAAIALGPAGRIGRTSAGDPGADLLQRRLTVALDPLAVLA